MECKGCTLCCDLFPVKELDKPANVKCKYCDKGCIIHETRPNVWRGFECAYYQLDKVSEDLRPNNCKVIFEKLHDTLFLGTLHPDFELGGVARNQIASFNKQGISTLIVSSDNRKPVLFVADGHDPYEIHKIWLYRVTQLT